MAAGRSAPKTDIQGANTPPSPSRPFSNRLTSVEAALQDFKAGRFEPVVTELPHHNGYSSFVFQEKGRAVPAPVKGNPKATRVEAGPKVYLPDVPTAERPRLQQGIEEAKGSIQTSSAAVESTSGPTTVVAPSGSSNTSNLLTGLIVALMAANLIAVLASRSGGKNSELAKKQLALMERQLKQHENMEKFGQAAGSSVDELPETRLDDVGGNFVAKEELRSIIRKIKRRMNGEEVMIPKGILLEGPPGNGKTLMARAVAGEAGIPFYSLSGSEFNQMFVGVGASRVRDVFARAKENAPAIIFIDEIDAIAQARSSGLATHRNEERESTLTELLRQMDGFEASENVFVLAATNRKDVLDSALTDRPSRFKYSIFIDNPRSDEERQEVLAIHQQRAIKKLNVRFPETVDGVPFLTKLAQVTRGLSGDKLQHVILEAAEVAQARAEADYEKQHGQLPLAAKIEGYEDNRPVGQVSFADCIEAYQKIQYGHLSKVKHSLPARRKVGFHEHGHNILAYALHKLSPMVISMLSRDKSLGRIILDPTTFDEQLHSQSDLLGRVLVYMGGTAGEEFEYGKGGRTTGNSADVDSAQSLVVSLISHGLLDDNYAVNLKRQSISELSPEEKDQLNRVIRNAKQTALTILNAIGKENLNRMVEESLACDHEMVGEEATAFNQRHLDSHWDRIHTLAQAFLDNPEGKSVS
jgi:ATP-dependent metalloprotease FtsH